MEQIQSVTKENNPNFSVRSALTSETGKKMVSPDRELFHPKLKNDSLSVQLEEVRLHGVCMDNMIENITKIFLKLSEEGGHLCKDNKILKITMENISMAEQPSVS